MSKAYEFIKECGSFFVVTLNGDFPAARPFGAIMEVEDKLYIATNDRNEVHKQLRANGDMQITAKQKDTREWVRVTGTAEECNDIAMKQKFLEVCPNLLKHYDSADSEHYLVFAITVNNVEFK